MTFYIYILYIFLKRKTGSFRNSYYGIFYEYIQTIDKLDEHNYEGPAGDVVGKAKGYSYGPAFKFEYVLLVPVKGKEMKITFDDWIFMQDEKVAINRATMTKFGFKVAELTVVFVKD